MREGNVFGFETAAVLWDVPLPTATSIIAIDVVAPFPRRAPEGSGITGRRARLRSHHVDVVDGLAVTSAARTWCDLAETLTVVDLVAAGEWLVTGNPYGSVLPMTSIDELTSMVGELRGTRGGARRMRALPLIREGALSRPETLLRLLLERAGIPRPKINAHVHDDRGSFLAMPDLCWPEYKVAVEYEGRHHAGTTQFRKDIRRIERLVDHGWIVVKISALDLFDEPSEAVARVSRRLASRGWRGRPSLRHMHQFTR